MPSVKGHREWQLCCSAPAPVKDPRHQDVERDEDEQEVRDDKSDPPLDEQSGPGHLGGQASQGPATLNQVYDHQPDEGEADVGVIGDPHVQELQCPDGGHC